MTKQLSCVVFIENMFYCSKLFILLNLNSHCLIGSYIRLQKEKKIKRYVFQKNMKDFSFTKKIFFSKFDPCPLRVPRNSTSCNKEPKWNRFGNSIFYSYHIAPHHHRTFCWCFFILRRSLLFSFVATVISKRMYYIASLIMFSKS